MKFVVRYFVIISLFIAAMIGYGYFSQKNFVLTTSWWKALFGPFAIYSIKTPEHPIKDYTMTALMSACFVMPCLFLCRWDRAIWRFLSFCGIGLWYFFGLAVVMGWTW